MDMKQINLDYKLFILCKTLSTLDMYFAHWDRVPKLDTGKLQKEYIQIIKNTKDRYEFYLVMCCMIAKLNNRHTWYYDKVIWKNYGMSIGFRSIYHDKLKEWVIVSSRNGNIPVGSIITKVNGVSTNDFFNSKKKYITASNERAARNKLFSFVTCLPKELEIELDNKSNISVNRTRTDGVLEESVSYTIFEKKAGYIKIPSFAEPKYEKAALNYLNKMKSLRTVIIDLRDNNGGSTPKNLLSKLLNKSWRSPLYLEVVTPTALEKQYNNTKPYNKKGYRLDKNKIYKENYGEYKPSKNVYKGKVIVLTNESTSSAAEDFLIPLKYNKRVTVVGSRTNGSDGDVFFYNFDKDIFIGIGCVSVRFPNGRKIEGIGISPDVEVYPKLEDIKRNIDVVLKKALEIT